jgi:putative spermidine/putrescine transport system substrate-binding protein
MKARVFATVMSVILLGASGVANAQGTRFDGVTLRVGTFGGGWRDSVHALVGKKMEALGAKVEYVLGNPAENLAKLIAARGQTAPIDVMEVGPAERVAMLQEDLLAVIPSSEIPNLAKLPSQITEPKLVPHIIVQNGIVYRADVFAEEKIPVPKSYGDLANPKLSGRVAFPDVTNTQFWTAAAALAYEGGGNESTPDVAFANVLKIKPLYYFSAATELAQKFSLGDVVAAPWHAGWAVRFDKAGLKVGFVNPAVGSRYGAIEYNYLGIVKTSKNAAAAAAFINAFLDTSAQTEFARAVGIVPTNREARAQLTSDPVLSKYMLLRDDEIDKAFVVDWSKVNQQQWRSDWARSINK